MSDSGERVPVQQARIDGIPAIWILPVTRTATAPLALWLPPLSRTARDLIPFLRELAGAGFVAVSFDAWQHGERGDESGEQIIERVFGNFRRHMWPVLGQTTLDCLRVIDWAIGELAAGPEVVAGGVSMGGDVAVALGGIDRRVSRVAAIVATPDWARPGMRDLSDPLRILPQGEPDSYARWFYERLDPISHLDSYADGPAITFECAADDTHVPPDGALRFQRALIEAFPYASERIRVNLHPGLGHLEGALDPALSRNCLQWLADQRS